MQILEIIKSKISFPDNDFQIEECICNKKERTLSLSFIFDNVLCYSDYFAFKKVCNEVFASDGLITIKGISIGYKNDYISDQVFNEYYDSILNDLLASSPRYNALINTEKVYDEHVLTINVEQDAKGINELASIIEESFNGFGLLVSINLKYDETKSINEVILEENEKEFTKIESTIKEAEKIEKKAQEVKNALKSTKRYKYDRTVALISTIPNTANDISIYQVEKGRAEFTIEASYFFKEIKQYAKSKLVTLKVTDYSDSIIVKKWIRNDDETKMFTDMKEDEIYQITGIAEYDQYTKGVVINANSFALVGKRKSVEVEDNAPVKRVELHCHTKMSNLDGITEATDYINQAIAWGHKAIAITDHSGVYSIPDINHATEGKDIKPIFGAEFAFVDDSDYKIAFTDDTASLRDSTYVVFDIETTGLSQTFDDIIEIAAIKVYKGAIVDKYETFINPNRPLPEKIIKLTSIDDDMLKDAKDITQVLPDFLTFCGDAILVAHNASFDTGMIYANIERLGLKKINYKIIDTLNALRAMYGSELKTFNLTSMSKFFKVKQEHHHRAIDDTRVTAECFLYILQEMQKRGVMDYKDINSLIDPNSFYKVVIPSHINIIAKNQVGYRNLFRIVSDALTVHCYSEGRLLKSVLERYREGILVGSGCVNGLVFETALNGSLENLKKYINYCDYIEVQPPKGYMQLFNSMPNGEEVVKKTIMKIINTAKELNKIVVATSDCHYLRPNEKRYRDILIMAPQIGGGIHSLARGVTPDNPLVSPDMHMRTTNEMLEEFNFLDKDLAYEIVVTNTNLIADQTEKIECFHKEMFVPADDEFKDSLNVPSIVSEMKRIVSANVLKTYGENPHPIVTKRINRELNSIISNGYSSVYYMAHLLVTKSLSDGYLVGSRGSVGSSLVATMMNITEINPLSPHYRCKKCKFTVFKMNEEDRKTYSLTKDEESFQGILNSVESGYDLPDAVCPICGEKLTKDGHDIPFETFLGFNGDKVPDIDLNFSSEYQSIAHEYVRTLMGEEHAFRSGTVGTIADKNAYGYVMGYCEKKGISLRSCEIDRIASHLVGVKRSTGQHPGGIIVVPRANEIYDVTPLQYPADNIDNAWRTTHFDYHSFENNLLKLDILGHDDPTIIKFIMDYVHLHQSDFPFSSPQDIPIDDKNVYRLFSGTDIIGVSEDDIGNKVASFAVPELGTNFVCQMLNETRPRTFAQLVKISGLSHGTDVWLSNAQELVNNKTEFGKIDFANIIGCRDDIMVDLLYMGLEPLKAFEIMEFVRKGKVAGNPDKWAKYRSYMEEKNVPKWYIWSCEKIKYMFPKAHATAYVLMALRLAWFKVYSPLLFYSAYFSKRAPAHSVNGYLMNKETLKAHISNLEQMPKKTVKEEDVITSLKVALEMIARGYTFLPVDIVKSDALIFKIEGESLRIPFIAVDGLGAASAMDIQAKREVKAFTSKKDIMNRTKLNQTLFEVFDSDGAFGDLPEEDELVTEGLFAFL